MKSNKYNVKRFIACFFCIIMMLTVSCFVSYAADCNHANGYEWITTSQTCTVEGKKELRCTECGALSEDEGAVITIPAHNYKVVFTAKTATCVDEGLNVEYCSWCMSYRNVVIPVDNSNHNYREWIIGRESTCSTAGERYRMCDRVGCTNPKQTEELPLSNTGHIAADDAVWVPDKPADCSNPGSEITTCTECNKTFSREIPTHSDVARLTGDELAAKYKYESTIPGTCMAKGSIIYSCEKCGRDAVVKTDIDENNHNYEANWTILEQATCDKDGLRRRYCTNNRVHYEEETYREEHDFSIEISFEPGDTCDDISKRTWKCANCDETYIEEVTEHLFTKWEFASGSSCANGGTATRTCLCEEQVEETVAFEAGTHLNYTLEKDAKPTCTTNGYKEIYCDDCDKKVTIIPKGYEAFGHTLNNWVNTVEPTCTNSGIRIRTCSTCNQKLGEETLPVRAHTYIVLEAGVDATCTENGISPYLLCTSCFKEERPEVVTSLGHNFVEQNHNGDESVLICNRCFQYQVGTDEEGNDVICECLCHNSDGIAKTIYRFITLFNKLFGIKQFCECGAQHYDDTSIFEDLFGPILGIFGG